MKTENFYVVRSWNKHHFSLDSAGRVYYGNGIQPFHKMSLVDAKDLYDQINSGCTIYSLDLRVIESGGAFKGSVEIVRMAVSTEEEIVASQAYDFEDEDSPPPPTSTAIS